MTSNVDEPGTDSGLATRKSLLSRLRDCQDQAGWREFFETYWRLIYNVARKAGLGDPAAQDVVQNTFIYLSRRMPNFHYDRTRGSFKSWLRVVTRSRLHAYWRAERSGEALQREPLFSEGSDETDPVDTLPDPAVDAFNDAWQREWEENVMSTAFRRLRSKVSAQQLLIFRLSMLGELSLIQVAKKLDVSVAQVYLARHRVARLLKAEVARIRRETE